MWEVALLTMQPPTSPFILIFALFNYLLERTGQNPKIFIHGDANEILNLN